MKLPSIKLSTSRLLQYLLIALHIANFLIPQIPPDMKPYVLGFIGIGNILVNEAAHKSTTDGQPSA